jgi:hypothetical protein
MLWFGSWLSGDDGSEGDWYYSGRGGEFGRYDVPGNATGVRIRRWPNEGLDAEYVDVLSFRGETIAADALDFDAPQHYSRLNLVLSRTHPEVSP